MTRPPITVVHPHVRCEDHKCPAVGLCAVGLCAAGLCAAGLCAMVQQMLPFTGGEVCQ